MLCSDPVLPAEDANGTIMMVKRCLCLAVPLLLAACVTPPSEGPVLDPDILPVEARPLSGDKPLSVPVLPQEGPAAPSREQRSRAQVELYPGNGVFLDRSRAAGRDEAAAKEGDITLNFEGADLREVIRFVLGDMLNQNYLVDPRVQGQVTLQTSRPLTREALLPTLEEVLRMNGLVLARESGLYRVMPQEGALRGVVPRLTSGDDAAGYGVRIIPLDYVAAQEMKLILEPFLSPGALVRVDGMRNLLIVAGNTRDLDKLQETAEIFDVDFLKGMSVGLFTLENVEVPDITAELERLFGESSASPLAGMFRFIPIERLNAILVVTPQPDYLKQAKVWVQRLDRTRAQAVTVPRLYVYRMQHGRAVDAATVLGEVFGGKAGAKATATDTGPSLAPGLEPAEISSGEGGVQTPATAGESGNRPRQALTAEVGEVRIVADEVNNALLVRATERDYEVVQSAIEQLDIPPLQVLVDASIIEISLTGTLRYGLQWFFKNSVGSKTGRGIFADAATLGATFPGFNYSLVDSANQVRAVLDALATDEKVNVVSSPSVMVLDNQEATIKVGDQVPIRTSESVNTSSSDPVRTSTIQYRDTGVSLNVKPRVNAGGMVIMEIDQEVNDVSSTQSSNIDSPTIRQRRISSSVAVQSGETIVLGGLIRETRSNNDSGVPGLYKIPVVGPLLFGNTSQDARRTELVVLLTPRVAHNQLAARQITEDFKRRLGRLSFPTLRRPKEAVE